MNVQSPSPGLAWLDNLLALEVHIAGESVTFFQVPERPEKLHVRDLISGVFYD